MISEREIASRLRGGFLAPEVDAAPREAAIASACARLRTSVAPEPAVPAEERRPTHGAGTWRAGLRPALLTLLLLVVVLMAATPAGRSIAQEIGELIGIGDDPTEEPIFDEPGTSRREIVVGVGEAPGGARYEVVGESVAESGRESVCFRVSFPDYEPRGVQQCVTPAAASHFTDASLIPAAYAGADGSPVVAGLTGSDIASVEVSGRGGDGPTEAILFPLDPELAVAIGTDLEAGYFVAFPAESQNAAEVAAYDAAGAELAREPVSVPPPEQPTDSVKP